MNPTQFTVPTGELTATGYESVRHELYMHAIKYQETSTADAESREQIISEVTELIWEKRPFPIRYFSERGAKAEILRCMETEAEYGTAREPGLLVASQRRAGVDLCKWAFPNLHRAKAKTDSVSLWDKFHNRERLREAIIWACRDTARNREQVVSPGWLYYGLRGGGAAPTNFPPMAAKAIFERYVPKNGVIWDPSFGYGGRLLGALTSRNEYTYIGTDPATETFENLSHLGRLIERVTGRRHSFHLHQCGSEGFDQRKEDVDFVFTSPPYFDSEDYDDPDEVARKKQSHVKYPTPEAWVGGFIRGTARNIRRALKPGAYCVINIADQARGKIDLVDGWVDELEDAGLCLQRRDSLAVKARAKSAYQAAGSVNEKLGRVKGKRKEPLLVFKRS